MTQNQETYRRATNAALAGMCVQIVLTIIVAIMGLWAQSPALNAATWHFLGGLPIWLILLLLFHQHRLEGDEALEAQQLARSDAQTAALFEERADELQLARRRLANLYKWGLSIVSLLVAVYLLVLGSVLLWVNLATLEGENLKVSAFFTEALRPESNPMVLMGLSVVVAMMAFLVARYIAGMTKIHQWQVLRGGAGYLMGNALVAAAVLVGAVFAHFGTMQIMAYLRLVIPVFMMLIGIEIFLTFLLSAYRPRQPGEVPRPAFDSRALGLLTTPQSIAKAIGDTINYQFGFEISSSWFYQLLARAITPLVIFGLTVLVLSSSFVIVQSYENAVVTVFSNWGDPPRVLGPGLHLKWPWPIASIQKHAVKRIRQITVATFETELRPNVPILWTNEHAFGEETYLVTAPPPLYEIDQDTHQTPDPHDGTEKVPPDMGLIGGQVVIQYHIGNLEKYLRSALDPPQRLEAITERAVNAYFLSKDIDALLLRSRIEKTDTGESFVAFSEDLRKQIQIDVDEAELGFQIVFVNVATLHPPQKDEVALKFHERIGAEQDKQGTIEKARSQAIETLAKTAGSQKAAGDLYAAILDYSTEKAKLKAIKANVVGETDPRHQQQRDRIEEKANRINELLVAARGEAAKQIFNARGERWEDALQARAQAEQFDVELAAYHSAPQYYRVKRFLAVIAEALRDVRKTIIPTERAVYRLDLTEGLTDLNLLTPER